MNSYVIGILRAILCLLIAASLSSCGLLMVHSTVKRPNLHPGAKRENVIAEIGEPKKTMPFHPPRIAASIPGSPASLRSARIGRYDDYSISGLVQLPGDNYADDWSQYGLGFIFTLGIQELFIDAPIAADLSYKSLKRYELRLWYDPSLKLLGHERRKHGILP